MIFFKRNIAIAILDFSQFIGIGIAYILPGLILNLFDTSIFNLMLVEAIIITFLSFPSLIWMQGKPKDSQW